MFNVPSVSVFIITLLFPSLLPKQPTPSSVASKVKLVILTFNLPSTSVLRSLEFATVWSVEPYIETESVVGVNVIPSTTRLLFRIPFASQATSLKDSTPPLVYVAFILLRTLTEPTTVLGCSALES